MKEYYTLLIIGFVFFFFFSGWQVITIYRRKRAIELLTYEEAITYFINNKPGEEFAKAIMMRTMKKDGTYLVKQLFLDEKDEILKKPNGSPYGRSIHVITMDQELLEIFSDKDVIVVT